MNMYKSPFNLLTEYFVRENHIDMSLSYEIETVPAISLICENRFDLLAKWVYIDAREKCTDYSWAQKIYFDNINAFSCGTFLEPGTDEKNTFSKYLDEFNCIIEDIKRNGFDETISLIPVGKDNIILDGAHRVAAAAYYGKDVTVIRFPKLTRQFDYRYFRKYLMTDVNMGIMAIYYAHIRKNCYMACLWPMADQSLLDDAEVELRKAARVVYSQDVYLTYRGMRNFMVQIYGHQRWTGNIENHFNGVYGKVDACYKKEYAVRTYLLEADSLEKVIEIKKNIRDIFQIENHSIHIADNQQETEEMVQLLYNSGSLEFLNIAEPYKFDYVFKKLIEIKDFIKRNGYKAERFIIDSSAVLEVCGLRQAKDIDYLTDYEDIECSFGDDVDNHKSQLQYYDCTSRDLLYNPLNYFFFNGMKFVSVRKLMQMKKNRNEPKDVIDIELCEEFLKKKKDIPYKYRAETHEFINEYQKAYRDYGHGTYSVEEYRNKRIKEFLSRILRPVYIVRNIFTRSFVTEKCRQLYIYIKRKKLRNKDISIISSNCNGGVISSDLGLEFNSPFVNLFIKADDYVKILGDLKGYIESELRFVKEKDPIYGDVKYPTAYLRDAKIYFMHYKSEKEAVDAWNRRKKRINWENLYILFTDRSGCTQEDLEAFDRLPYEHKVVFTHVPHPEIKSSFYIKGYEDEDKVGILADYQNAKYPFKRQLDQFDFVRWFNNR